ncbi:hypothetical protein AAIH16_39810, partial [Pseudomonas aeruginosa]
IYPILPILRVLRIEQQRAQPSSWAFPFLQVAHCAAGRAAPLKGRTCTYPWPSPRAGLFHFRPGEGNRDDEDA